jgi:hypothetical protein
MCRALFAAALSLSAASGCAAATEDAHSARPDLDDTGAPTPTPTPTGVSLSAVQWAVDWQTDGLRWREDGGWSLQRDDGLELEVHEGWLVVYMLVLEPCEEASAQRSAPPPHSLPDHDSALGVSLATSLHALEPVSGTAHSFETDAFCALGVGLIRGDTSTENIDDEVNLNGLSLVLSGRYRTAPTGEWTTLSLQSSLPAEADLSLPETTPADAVVATLQLQPAAMVAALDPEAAPERIALDLLEALATTGEVFFTPLSTDPESP